jgi:hypothetical protein
MDPTKKQHQILGKAWKNCDRDPGNDRKNVQGKKYEANTEDSTPSRLKRARQKKIKVKSMLIILF